MSNLDLYSKRDLYTYRARVVESTKQGVYDALTAQLIVDKASVIIDTKCHLEHLKYSQVREIALDKTKPSYQQGLFIIRDRALKISESLHPLSANDRTALLNAQRILSQEK